MVVGILFAVFLAIGIVGGTVAAISIASGYGSTADIGRAIGMFASFSGVHLSALMNTSTVASPR